VGSQDQWFFGATEEPTASPAVLLAGATGVSAFQNRRAYHGDSKRYTQYRCVDWPSSEALDIFRAYGVNNLPNGNSVFPNFYFDHLPSIWGATLPLVPQQSQSNFGVA
jgi:hypothetical protein